MFIIHIEEQSPQRILRPLLPEYRSRNNKAHTQEMLDDWATYDSSGPAQIKNAMKTREVIGVLYGMDGIPLDAITHERYLLSGSYDAEKFASGDYVLVIGPAIDSADTERKTALPVPTVGSSIALENRTYTVMAVAGRIVSCPIVQHFLCIEGADILHSLIIQCQFKLMRILMTNRFQTSQSFHGCHQLQARRKANAPGMALPLPVWPGRIWGGTKNGQ